MTARPRLLTAWSRLAAIWIWLLSPLGWFMVTLSFVLTGALATEWRATGLLLLVVHLGVRVERLEKSE